MHGVVSFLSFQVQRLAVSVLEIESGRRIVKKYKNVLKKQQEVNLVSNSDLRR